MKHLIRSSRSEASIKSNNHGELFDQVLIARQSTHCHLLFASWFAMLCTMPFLFLIIALFVSLFAHTAIPRLFPFISLVVHVFPYLLGNHTICSQVLQLKKLASWKQFLFYTCLQQHFLVLDSKEIASRHHHPSQVLIISFANGTIHSCSSIPRHGIIG